MKVKLTTTAFLSSGSEGCSVRKMLAVMAKKSAGP